MALDIPGYQVGTWTIDHSHTEIGFSIRHLMISKVKGVFDKFEGEIITAEDPLQSRITATIDAASINTKDERRDGHIRTGDFLLVEEYPTLAFASTAVRHELGEFFIDGDLTIRGVTRPVTLDFEFGGFGQDAYGVQRAGGSASTTINRNDFGVSFNGVLEGGGVVLGDDVAISLEIQAIRQG